MKRIHSSRLIAVIAIVASVVLPAILGAQQTQPPRQLFERALILEESNQPKEAVKLYEEVVAKAKTDPALAAKAQYQAGLVYEKLGDKESARKAYEQVLTKYAKQPEAGNAKIRITSLTSPAAPVLPSRKQIEKSRLAT
jgi:tetratricopeptide (TPR) repeat protein